MCESIALIELVSDIQFMRQGILCYHYSIVFLLSKEDAIYDFLDLKGIWVMKTSKNCLKYIAFAP